MQSDAVNRRGESTRNTVTITEQNQGTRGLVRCLPPGTVKQCNNKSSGSVIAANNAVAVNLLLGSAMPECCSRALQR